MDPIIGSAIIGAGANLYAANKSASSAKKANALNAMMAYSLQERQENFEKWKLANTYQETAKDMAKAGINPILGLSQQGGTSVGGIGDSFAGAQQGDYSSIGNIGNQLLQANSARQNEQHLQNEQTGVIAQSAKNLADATKSMKEAGILGKYGEQKAQAEIGQMISTTAKTNQETNMLKEQAPYILSQQFGKASQELYKGRLSDVSADFLNQYGISRDEAFRIGELGLRGISQLAQLGLGKFAIQKLLKSPKAIKALKSGRPLKLQEIEKLLKE